MHTIFTVFSEATQGFCLPEWNTKKSRRRNEYYAIIRISENTQCSTPVPGPVWLEDRPSHERLGLGCAIISEAVCQGKNQNLDQNLLGKAEKLIPVRPITDTRLKLPEVGSDPGDGAKS